MICPMWSSVCNRTSTTEISERRRMGEFRRVPPSGETRRTHKMGPELKMTTAARERRVRRAAKSIRTTVGYGARVQKDPRSGRYSLIDIGTTGLIADDLDLGSLEDW